MTDWERMKLGFYRSDKAWEENIRSRKVMPDKNGKLRTYLTDHKGNIKMEMPQP